MHIGMYSISPIAHCGRIIGSLLGRGTAVAYGASPLRSNSTVAGFPPPTSVASPHGLWSLGNGRGNSAGVGGAGNDDKNNHNNDDQRDDSSLAFTAVIASAILLLCALGLAACDVGSQNFPPEEEPPRPDAQGNDGVVILSDTTPTHDTIPTSDLADNQGPSDVPTDTKTDTADGTTGDLSADTAFDVPDTVMPAIFAWCTNDDGNECLSVASIANAVATTLMLNQDVIVKAGSVGATTQPFSPDLFFDIANGPLAITMSSDAGTVPTALAGGEHQILLTPPLFITDETDPNYWADNNAAWLGEYIWTSAQSPTLSMTAGLVPDAQNANISIPVLHLRASHVYSAGAAQQQCTTIYFHPCLTELKPIATP